MQDSQSLLDKRSLKLQNLRNQYIEQSKTWQHPELLKDILLSIDEELESIRKYHG